MRCPARPLTGGYRISCTLMTVAVFVAAIAIATKPAPNHLSPLTCLPGVRVVLVVSASVRWTNLIRTPELNPLVLSPGPPGSLRR